MWTAKIASKEFKNGRITVIVEFSNGIDAFTELMTLQVGDQLNALIKSRLEQITATESFYNSLELGSFAPKDEVPPPAPEKSALAKFVEIKNFVDLGLIPPDSPEFSKAQEAAKSELSI